MFCDILSISFITRYALFIIPYLYSLSFVYSRVGDFLGNVLYWARISVLHYKIFFHTEEGYKPAFIKFYYLS